MRENLVVPISGPISRQADAMPGTLPLAIPPDSALAALLAPQAVHSVFGDHGWEGTREIWQPPGTVPADLVPDIQRHLAAVDAVLCPAERGALLTRILTLLAHYRDRDPLPPDVERAIAQDWAEDLGLFPLWAVEEACRNWRRDKRRYRFKPLPGDIRNLCEQAVEHPARLRHRLGKLLDVAGIGCRTPVLPADPGRQRAADLRGRIRMLAEEKRVGQGRG